MKENGLDTNTEKTLKQIDVAKIVNILWKNKKKYYFVLPIVFVLSCAFILCVPRYYKSSVSLAPELSSFSGNSLSDIASSFGVDLGSATSGSGDAILPELYPEIIGSINFQVGLFDVKVKTLDGSVNTKYYDYLLNHQEKAFWNSIFNWIKSLFPNDDLKAQKSDSINPFMLTRKQTSIAMEIGENIVCDVDKKNYVITITVTDQDPLICATMADSVKGRLQNFITDYRTSKARVDLEYAEKLRDEVKEKYFEARDKYSKYTDSHRNSILEAYVTKRDELENDMQILFNNYNLQTNQVLQARAKVQEETPAFTTLQSATVPVKPAGPKRMIFVGVMTILALAITSAVILYKNKSEITY